jgi:hypothetical protein
LLEAKNSSPTAETDPAVLLVVAAIERWLAGAGQLPHSCSPS